MKKLLTGALLILILTSSTQTERLYQVKVRANFFGRYMVKEYTVRSRNRSMAEEEAHMLMINEISTRTVSVKEIKRPR